MLLLAQHLYCLAQYYSTAVAFHGFRVCATLLDTCYNKSSKEVYKARINSIRATSGKQLRFVKEGRSENDEGLTTAFSLIAVLCLFGCSGNGVHDAGDEEQEDANLQPAFVLKSIDAHATIHDGSAVNVVQNIATMELDDRGNVIRAVYRNQDSGSDIVVVESEFDERGFPVGRIVEKKLSDETAGTVVTSTRFQCTPDGEGRLLSAEWESEVSFGSDKVTRASGVDRYSYSQKVVWRKYQANRKRKMGKAMRDRRVMTKPGFLSA